jgi:hypothetical protein
VQAFSKAKGPLVGRIIAAIAFSTLARQAQHDIDAFGTRLEKDLVAREIGLEASKVPAKTVVEAAVSG